MRRLRRSALALAVPLALLSGAAPTEPLAPPAGDALEAAVREIRDTNLKALGEAERDKKIKAIESAWETLQGAGKRGADRLKREIASLEAAGKKDDVFRLGAAALLWQIGKLDEAGEIARIWRGTPLDAQFQYVFMTAFQAAMTQDERALPMLLAVLPDEKGVAYVPQHAMDIPAPLSHYFLWGAYGPKGLPVLVRRLSESKDPVEIRHAIFLVSLAQCREALPRLRALAKDPDAEVRREAVKGIGLLGQPEDFDALAAGLASKEPKDAWASAYALYEFEDPRAVPALVPLLKSPDAPLRGEVLAALAHLSTPEALEAISAHAAKAAGGGEKENCGRILEETARALGTSWEEFSKKPLAERKALLDGLRAGALALKKGEAPVSRDELLRAIREWKKNGRFGEGDSDRFSLPQILAAGKPEDVEPLLEAKAALCRRLSDECMYETRVLDEAVKRLGRSRDRRP